MNEFDLSGSHQPQNADEKDKRVVPASEKSREAILYKDHDIFIKKTFETDPRKAFELLFKKYYSVLCNHAVRFLYSKQKAEDLVADIFVLFWNSMLYNNVKTNYRSYFFTAVRNKCYTYLKWELSKETFADLNEGIEKSGIVTPEEIMMASDLHIKIERTIKGLPAKQQQVFVMSRFEGKKNAAIAKELNLSIKTVEMHISRALSTFRKIFSEES